MIQIFLQYGLDVRSVTQQPEAQFHLAADRGRHTSRVAASGTVLNYQWQRNPRAPEPSSISRNGSAIAWDGNQAPAFGAVVSRARPTVALGRIGARYRRNPSASAWPHAIRYLLRHPPTACGQRHQARPPNSTSAWPTWTARAAVDLGRLLRLAQLVSTSTDARADIGREPGAWTLNDFFAFLKRV